MMLRLVPTNTQREWRDREVQNKWAQGVTHPGIYEVYFETRQTWSISGPREAGREGRCFMPRTWFMTTSRHRQKSVLSLWHAIVAVLLLSDTTRLQPNGCAAARVCSPGAAARHPKFTIPIGGFLHWGARQADGSPGAAARQSQSARVHTDSCTTIIFFQKQHFLPKKPG